MVPIGGPGTPIPSDRNLVTNVVPEDSLPVKYNIETDDEKNDLQRFKDQNKNNYSRHKFQCLLLSLHTHTHTNYSIQSFRK